MFKFNMGFFAIDPASCGKETRKYIYVMGAVAVLTVSLTYIYEYHYKPAQHAVHDAMSA
ncbi:MAG: hypothetical protein HQL49_07110 [Gammaproteobacteria bacterium]|nr:hypothetical protein [Gammaproteobacteria bacterium]